MKCFLIIGIIVCVMVLGGCDSGEKKTNSSDHLLKEHKLALDKAKEVDRLAREAAERQRKAIDQGATTGDQR